VRCPWCDYEDAPRPLHAHLADRHADGVQFVYRGKSPRYEIVCPICQVGYDQAIRPGSNDPEDLVEFEREIRLVAFDMLVHHIIGEHPDATSAEEPTVPAKRE
jgi:hypothetical protein